MTIHWVYCLQGLIFSTLSVILSNSSPEPPSTTVALQQMLTAQMVLPPPEGGTRLPLPDITVADESDNPPPLPSSSPPRDEFTLLQRTKPKPLSPKPVLSKQDLMRTPGGLNRTSRPRSPSPRNTTLTPGGSTGSSQSPLVVAPHLRKDLFSAPKVVSPTRLRKFGSASPTANHDESPVREVNTGEKSVFTEKKINATAAIESKTGDTSIKDASTV